MARKGAFRLMRLIEVEYEGAQVKAYLPVKAGREINSTLDAKAYLREQEGKVSGNILIVDLKGAVKIEAVQKTVVAITDISNGKPEAKAGKKGKKAAAAPDAGSAAPDAGAEPADPAM